MRRRVQRSLKLSLKYNSNHRNLYKEIYLFSNMNKWTEILLGLILIIGMIILAYYSADWTIAGKSLDLLHSGWVFLKGGIFWLVIMMGLLFLMLGISDLRE